MKQDQLSCAAARDQFALLLYGELSFDEEERIESHLDTCGDCRTGLARERSLHAAFDHIEISPAPSLLRECREDLRTRLMDEDAQPRSSREAREGWWERFVDAITLQPSSGVLRPAGALALIALGFAGAKMWPAAGGSGTGFIGAQMTEPGAERVRHVEPSSDGRVQIVLDETRQKTISGRLDDQQFRALIYTAIKDPSDPGLRVDAVEVLTPRAQLTDVRDALIFALQNDKNTGVRMKVMEGLKPFAGQPEVRAALAQVLLSDANPGLRTQAIDLLTGPSNGSVEAVMDRPAIDRQIIGTLQELMLRGEKQDYIRERSRRVLEAMNASIETY